MEQEKPQSGFVQSPTLSVSVGEGQCGARAQGVDGLHDGLGDSQMLGEGRVSRSAKRRAKAWNSWTMRCA